MTATFAPGLNILKSVSEGTGAPGDILTYVILFNYTGGSSATGVTVVDSIPQFSSFQWASGGTGHPHPDPSLSESDPGTGSTSGAITWSLPSLAGGSNETVTMAVQVDSAIDNTTTSSGLPGGRLFHEDFENPPYPQPSTITSASGTRWTTNARTAHYYTVVSAPPGSSSQMADLQSAEGDFTSPAYPSLPGDALNTGVSFQGTVWVDFDARLQSSTNQTWFDLGTGQFGFDGGQFTFLGNYSGVPLLPTDANMHIRVLYNPTQGAVIAELWRSDGSLIWDKRGFTAALPPSSYFDLAFYNTALSKSFASDLLIDNVDIGRAVVNQAVLSASNVAGPVTAYAGTQVP